MRRREFLKKAGITPLALSGAGALGAHTGKERPNILFIMTDQQFADAMSCRMGREYIHTPNMDGLARDGFSFNRAYCANPLCIPSRASLFTGRYPHKTGRQANQRNDIDPDEFTCMGRLFGEAGYDTGYVGKWHMPFPKKATDAHGFQFTAKLHNEGHDVEIPEPAVKFMNRGRENPFLLVTSFCNPHNICEWSRFQKLPDGSIGDVPPVDERPPLPANQEPPENETDIISTMRRAYQRHRLFKAVSSYHEKEWRRLRWGYYRLLEKVDALIGEVLAGLREAGHEQDTLVVFTSDHGECLGAHRWNQKTVFYDESARVPLIMRFPGGTRRGNSDRLVQTGVDLLPTLCDFAGVPVPADLPGGSLKGLASGNSPGEWRDYVVVSNKMIQGEPVDGKTWEPEGRMVRSERYKYCVYSMGSSRESLVDMAEDSDEMVNQAYNPDFKSILRRHRRYLREHASRHGDALALDMLQDLTDA